MRTTYGIHRWTATGLIPAIALCTAACGDVARTGRSPAFAIIESLTADPGSTDAEDFSQVLLSDVQTYVTMTIDGEQTRVPTVFNDVGQVVFRLSVKNPGTPTSPLGPSTLNEITFTRYRVSFRRTDGRNREGVDVPYAFEGGMTVTVPSTGTATGIFDIVRHTSKSEPPLSNLVGHGGAGQINTIAEVTFYGRDQAGNEVTAGGLLTVNFSDFGDPQ